MISLAQFFLPVQFFDILYGVCRDYSDNIFIYLFVLYALLAYPEYDW